MESATCTNGLGRPAAFRWLAVGGTWLVLVLVVGWGVRQVREQVRGQVLGRDGEVLLAMARTQAGGDDLESVVAGDPFAVFVTIGKLEGIVAARMYDAGGQFLASVPDAVREGTVAAEDLAIVRSGRPVSRFRPELPFGEVFLSTNVLDAEAEAEVEAGTAVGRGGRGFPAIQVWVPLGRGADGAPAGVAEFVLEGSSVAREFARLDRRLWVNASMVLGAALGLTGAVLWWVFRQLERSHRLLAGRTESLQRANRELAQTARATALGAVTAHLVHGLKNPVSGLQSFVAAGPEGGGMDEEAWREARQATQRMQALIEQVVRVLREHESGLAYEVTAEELGAVVVERARAAATARQVELRLTCEGRRMIDNRVSGLLALMLTNLVDNAIEATSAGGAVRVGVNAEGPMLSAEVADAGPGLSAAARERLFQPQASGKSGGSGLGLAITRQLALALGGSVSLVDTGPTGTTFRVELPNAHSTAASSDGVAVAGP